MPKKAKVLAQNNITIFLGKEKIKPKFGNYLRN